MKIRSREGSFYELSPEQVLLSKILSEIDNSEESVMLDISTNTIQKIFDFLNYYTNNEKLPDNIIILNINNIYVLNVSQWYDNFVDFNMKDLINLTNAANFLDISVLLELCCAKIASLIKGKSKEEIREILELSNDFNNQEEKIIKNEHEWIHQFA